VQEHDVDGAQHVACNVTHHLHAARAQWRGGARIGLGRWAGGGGCTARAAVALLTFRLVVCSSSSARETVVCVCAGDTPPETPPEVLPPEAPPAVFPEAATEEAAAGPSPPAVAPCGAAGVGRAAGADGAAGASCKLPEAGADAARDVAASSATLGPAEPSLEVPGAGSPSPGGATCEFTWDVRCCADSQHGVNPTSDARNPPRARGRMRPRSGLSRGE